MIRSPYLSKDERRLIGEYLGSLGKSDASAQTAVIKHYDIKFQESYSKSVQEALSAGEPAYKLGILIGIALMIIVA